jgi:hypothetical protein
VCGVRRDDGRLRQLDRQQQPRRCPDDRAECHQHFHSGVALHVNLRPTVDTDARVHARAPAPTSAPPAPAATGLLADPATISQRFPAAPVGDCTTAGDSPYPLGTRVAWRVGVALVCADVNATTWQGHPVGFNVYFGAPVSQEAALALTQQLLPADATNPVFAEGMNNDVSSHPSGTCEVANYDSASASAAEHALDPSWKSDGKVNVVLYTGQSLDDGSDSAYVASTVRYASVGIQADLDAGGFIPC